MHAIDVPTRYLSDFEMVRPLTEETVGCRSARCSYLSLRFCMQYLPESSGHLSVASSAVISTGIVLCFSIMKSTIVVVSPE